MAARFWFDGNRSVTLSGNPAYAAAWTSKPADGAALSPLMAVRAQISGDAAEDGCGFSTTTSGVSTASQMWLSEPLAAQTIAGTLKGRMRGREDNASANANLAILVRVLSNDGSTVRGTLLALTSGSATGGTNPECPVAASSSGSVNREIPFPSASTLTSVNALDGDRLAVELGAAYFTTTASLHGFIDLPGDTGVDLPEDTTTTARDNPWIEFSQDVMFLPELVGVADVADGGWLNEAASAVNLYASVDEGSMPNDANWIQSGAAPVLDAVTLQLNPLSGSPSPGTVTTVLRVQRI